MEKKESGSCHIAANVVRWQNITSKPWPCGGTQTIIIWLIYKRELPGTKPEPVAKQLYVRLASV